MAEFKRSRLERNSEDQITKKTVLLGFLTVLSFVLIIVFGLPFLIRLSIFLGEAKNKRNGDNQEKVLPPLPPRLVVTYEATNSSQIDISGFSEPGVTVELLKNDVSVGKSEVSSNGDFKFKDISLDDGVNQFNAIASTEKGGSSELSKTVSIELDKVAPELVMINPSESELKVDYSDFDIVGKSEKGVSVTVNGRVALVDDEGKFKIKMQLTLGKNEMDIVVLDMAGNETKKKVTVTYEL